MLSVEQIRKIDPETDDMTDAEIEILRVDMYGTVQLAFEAWRQEKYGSKASHLVVTEAVKKS